MGRTKATDFRKYNEGTWKNRPKKRLSEQVLCLISPSTKYAIQKLIEKGRFPNTSEFMRHLIIRYLDETESW